MPHNFKLQIFKVKVVWLVFSQGHSISKLSSEYVSGDVKRPLQEAQGIVFTYFNFKMTISLEVREALHDFVIRFSVGNGQGKLKCSSSFSCFTFVVR